ncbi:hypothetical protein BDF19DRAFT_498790 [Syncephalis fuscata]|nr:hypothetical protein BDF19DRAFT_498790 [Syncephalis fuscata]
MVIDYNSAVYDMQHTCCIVAPLHMITARVVNLCSEYIAPSIIVIILCSAHSTMKLLDSDQNEVVKACDIYMNTYDCNGSTVTFYSLIGCCTTTAIVTIYGIYVFTARKNLGFPISIFRMVDGYWLPNYMEAFSIACCVANIFHLIKYMITLFDWPPSWIVRGVFNALALYTYVVAIAMLASGIISHIPKEFSNHSMHNWFDNSSHSSHSDMLIYVPSACCIYWTSIVFYVFQFVFVMATNVWFGWLRDYGHLRYHDLGNVLLSLSLATSLFALTMISIYYCYKFSRVIRAHLHRHNESAIVDGDEIKAARRFLRVFTILLCSLITGCGMAITASAFTPLFFKYIWFGLIVYIGGYGIAFPSYMGLIFYTLEQNTRAYVKRDSSYQESSPEYYSVTSTLPMPPRIGHIDSIDKELAKTNLYSYNNAGLQSTRVFSKGMGSGDDYLGADVTRCDAASGSAMYSNPFNSELSPSESSYVGVQSQALSRPNSNRNRRTNVLDPAGIIFTFHPFTPSDQHPPIEDIISQTATDEQDNDDNDA